MAKHDILLYNSTSSQFETNLGSNTARIKGDSSELFSVVSGSTELFKVDTANSSVVFESQVTASGNISGSATSTASFGGIVNVERLSGDASLITGAEVYEDGHISGSAQLATEISGAFDSGFRISSASSISGSSTSTGSFSHIHATDFDVTHANELIGLINVSESKGTVSSSAQIASAVSGAFSSGFEYTGEISGSSTSTGSFGYLHANDYPANADVTEVVNTEGSYPQNTVSSSNQIASDISGSFTSGFVYSGLISGSSASTASFDYAFVSDYSAISSFTELTNYEPAGALSGSAQIASAISGSFQKGFVLSGSSGAGEPLISGSSTSTASLDYIFSDYYSGDVSGITNVFDGTNSISASAQIAADVSGSYKHGFRIGSGSSVGYELGHIPSGSFLRKGQTSQNFSFSNKWSAGYWSLSGEPVNGKRYNGAGGGTVEAGIMAGGIKSPFTVLQHTELYDGSSFTSVAEIGEGKYETAGTGNADAFVLGGGQPSGTSVKEYNGSTWSTSTALPSYRRTHRFNGTQNSALSTGGIPATTSEALEYDGVTWTEGGDMIFAQALHGAAGSQNSTITQGGPSNQALAQEYDGSTWSTANSLPQNERGHEAAGTQNDAIFFGGQYTPLQSYFYDGTNWTVGPSGIINRAYCAQGSGVGGAGAWIHGESTIANGTTQNYYGNYEATASIGKFNSQTFQTEEIVITGSAVKIPVFDSDFNVDTRFGVLGNLSSYGAGEASSSNDVYGYGGRKINEDDDYLVSGHVGQLFVTNDGRLNFTFPTASVGSNPDPQDSGSYGVWSVASAHITNREGQATSGVQSAALMFGGRTPTLVGCTEEWNGVAWSEKNNLITSRRELWGAGSVNAMLAGAGYQPSAARDCTEEWNGNSWAAGGALIITRGNADGTGTINAGLTTGGRSGGTKYSDTEHYDGAAWSAAGALSTTAYTIAIAGTQNAAIGSGGNLHGTPSSNDGTCVEEYNGINWSSGGSMIIGRRRAATAGIQNAAWIAGGDFPGFAGATEEYNGTTWSRSGNLGTGRGYLHGGGDVSAGIVAGGKNPTKVQCTELYSGGTFHGVSSAWTTSNNMITARRYTMGVAGGLQNAALAIGGAEPAISDHVEHYDGNTWADGGFLPHTTRGTGAAGTENSALKFGGTPNTATVSYNGFVWQAGGALSTGTRYLGSAGLTEDSALAFGGLSPSYETDTEEYNGVTWSAGGALGTAVGYNTGVGSQNAALSMGGKNPASAAAGAVSGSTCHYDGTSWSAGGGLIHDVRESTSAGTQNAALLYGGNATPSAPAQTAEYDGCVWISCTDMNDGRFGGARGGGADFALMAGGGSPGAQSKTEEYVKTHSGKPYLLNKKIKAQE